MMIDPTSGERQKENQRTTKMFFFKSTQQRICQESCSDKEDNEYPATSDKISTQREKITRYAKSLNT